MPFIAGKQIKETISKGLNKLGAQIPVTEAQKSLHGIMTKMAMNYGGDVKEMQDEILNMMVKADKEGIKREDLLDIIQNIEGPDDTIKRAVTDVVASADEEDFLRKVPSEGLNVRPSAIDLTNKQRGLINPTLVTEDEAVHAASLSSKLDGGTNFTTNGHGVYVNKDYVVLKLNRNIDKKLLTQNLDIPGITPWKVVDREDGRFLVGTSSGGTLSKQKGKWTRAHLDNLEKTAAMLAQKGYALGPMTSSDVLVGAAGEAQIINPEVIRKIPRPKNRNIKKIEAAAAASKESLTNLIANTGDLPRSDLQVLSDIKATKKVSKSSFKFEDNAPDAARLVGSDQIYYSKSSDLVELANNTEWMKNLDPDTIKAMGIDKEIQKLKETGTARPIQVTVDDRGNLEIKEGSRRLAAALLAGYDDVPVERVPYTGEIAAKLDDQRVVTGPTRNAGDIVEDLPQSVRFLPGDLDNFAVQDVRFLGPKGVVRVGGDAVDRLSESPFLSDFRRWYTREDSVRDIGVSATRADTIVANQQSVLASGMARAFGSAGHSDEATLLFADLFNQANSPEEFFGLLRERAGIDITYAGRNAKDRALLNREFTQLKGEADSLLRDLAKDGLLVPSTRTPEGVGIATRNLGLTGVYAEGKDMVILNHSLNKQELMPFATAHLQENAADLAYDSRVVISALDGTDTIRAIDILGDAHPWSDRVLPSNSRFFIEESDKNRLAEEGISLWNDPKIKDILGPDAGELIKNKGQTFFMSRSGALVIGRQHNVEDLLHLTFGEGTKHAQEIGAVTKDTIYVSNVFGSAFPTFTAKDMKPFTKRLKEVANKFFEAGFDSNFRVNVELPFHDEIAQKVLHKEATLGELMKGEAVKIPEALEGLPTQPINLPNVVVSVKDKFNRITNPKVRELADWVVNKFDEIALKELDANLPLSYRTSYYARFLTPELMSKLDDMMLDFMKQKKGMLNWFNQSHKGRRFTDLRTDEINSLFSKMQKEFKVTGSDIVEFGNKNDSAFMRQLAASSPEGFDFFITDPFLSVQARSQIGLKSINIKEANDAIADPANGIVIASLTRDELNQVKNFEGTALQLQENLDNLRADGKILEQQLEGAPGPEEVEIITNRIRQNQEELEKAGAKWMKFSTGSMANDGRTTSDLISAVKGSRNQFVMASNDVKQLLREGKISENAVLGSTAAPMVRVNADVIPDGALLHIMDPEVAESMATRFGAIYNDPRPILEGYDKILNIWKNWTLFPIPKYHVRNFFSNILLGWLGRVEIGSYDQAARIQHVIRNYTTGALSRADMIEAMKGMQFASDSGQVSDGFELYSSWIHNGGITGGLHVNELGLDNVVARKSVSLGFSPATKMVGGGILTDNKLLRGGRKAAEVNENWFRFAAFIDGWTKTGSLDEAGLNMKKLFYNYNDLNALEKKVLRRVIPFYAWSRHNVPRMLETLVTQPILHYRLAQFIRNVEQGAGGPVREEEIPKWISDRAFLNVGKNDKGQLQLFVLDGVVPMVDAYRTMRSLSGVKDMVVEGLTPFLKVPIEQVMNKSAFTGREIERAPGEPARSFTLAQMGFSRRATTEGPNGLANLLLNESLVKNMRIFSIASQFVDDKIYGKGNIRNDQPTTAAWWLDFVLGRVYSVDTERAIQWDNIDRKKKVSRAKSFIKEGLEKGNPALVDFGRARLMQLEVVRDD